MSEVYVVKMKAKMQSMHNLLMLVETTCLSHVMRYEDYSMFPLLLRVTAHALKFMAMLKCKNVPNPYITPMIGVEEISEAE